MKKLFAVLCAVLSFSHVVAQDERTDLELNPSNMGTEFYFSVPPCYEDGASGTSAILIYVTSSSETKVRLEVEGKGAIYTKSLTPFTTGFFKLSPTEAQAFTKTGSQSSPPEAVYRNAGIHITSEKSISVTAVVRYQYTSDAFLVLPVSSLGKEYIVASMADMSAMYQGLDLPSETTITAVEDNTTFTFTLGGNNITRTTGGLSLNESKTFTMNRGDVVVFATNGDEHDLTGSKIVANKPVAVVSGNQCANVPTDKPWCDYIAEMEMPTNTWGKTYIVATPHGRMNGAMIKIFAKEPNTKVFRNGQLYKVLAKAGGVEGQGYIYDRNGAGTNNPTLYTADKPINITLFNPGQSDDNIVSDPFQMNQISNELFATSYVITTPGSKQSGYSFTNNYVELVYPLNQEILIGMMANGAITYAPVNSKFGNAPGKTLETKIDGVTWVVKYLLLPGDGTYYFRSNSKFGLYQYGFSNYDSYGQPGGVLIKDIASSDNSRDTKAPVIAYNKIGTSVTGWASDSASSTTFSSKLSRIELSSGSENVTIEVSSIVPGSTEYATFTIHRIDNTKRGVAVVSAYDVAGNVSTVTVLIEGFDAGYKPPITISSGKRTICVGESVTLSAPLGFKYYVWSNGIYTQSINFSPINPGERKFAVTVTDSLGFSFTSDTISFTIYSSPDKQTISKSGNSLTVPSGFAKYQWQYNGKNIDGATNNTYSNGGELFAGEYTALVYNNEGCGTYSFPYNIISTSVEDDNESITVYPSVVSSTLWVTAPRNESVVVEITSLNGSNVLTQTVAPLAGSNAAVDVSMLAKGSYIVTVKVAASKESFKIIKE